jgi:predicted transposase/invertase (TIGR01784 family)
MYAGRLSLGTEDDIALREKYAWELLNTTTEREYDSIQRKFILEFAGRIFWLDDPGMNRAVKEAYKMKTIPLDEYSKQIRREEALMEGESKKALEVAQNLLEMGLPVEQIAQGTGLSIEELGALRQ